MAEGFVNQYQYQEPIDSKASLGGPLRDALEFITSSLNRKKEAYLNQQTALPVRDPLGLLIIVIMILILIILIVMYV